MSTQRRDLTENQQYVLSLLRRRGAHFTARATEEAWVKEETYYLDSRNRAATGLKRAFSNGNKEAIGEKP